MKQLTKDHKLASFRAKHDPAAIYSEVQRLEGIVQKLNSPDAKDKISSSDRHMFTYPAKDRLKSSVFCYHELSEKTEEI